MPRLEHEADGMSLLALSTGKTLYLKLDHPACGMSHHWLDGPDAVALAEFILANITP